MKNPRSTVPRPKAVVVGLCAHGLAIVRALANCGVDVIAIESNSRLPGVKTRKASVFEIQEVNGPGLTDGLLALANSVGFEQSPVLFLTNDRMVRQIATDWEKLAEAYRLSWSASTEQVVRYLDKRYIEGRCAELGIPYPRTLVLEESGQDVTAVRYPAIVKPANPLGAFKAIVLKNESELRAATSRYAESLPFLVQDWVEGPDSALYVCAMLLQDGDVKMRFDGRKRASFPPSTGQTSVMEYYRNDEVYEIAKSFFSGLGIDGPVSIEVKKSHADTYYMIEPTVGRTDYFLDALSANGTNFPMCEFEVVTGGTNLQSISAEDRAVWFDTERDRTCFLRTFGCLYTNGRLRRPVFPFFKWDDVRPFIAAVGLAFPALLRSIHRKIKRTWRPNPN